mgnify:CR=1 FL=1
MPSFQPLLVRGLGEKVDRESAHVGASIARALDRLSYYLYIGQAPRRYRWIHFSELTLWRCYRAPDSSSGEPTSSVLGTGAGMDLQSLRLEEAEVLLRQVQVFDRHTLVAVIEVEAYAPTELRAHEREAIVSVRGTYAC